MKYLSLLLILPLISCMEALPVRPVLTCADCTGLTYYGPQQPDPRVEMARVITGGLSSMTGIIVGGDVLKSLGGATSTIERTTNNNTSRDNNNSVSDVSRVSDTTTSSSQYISTSSVSDTSVSDTSASVSNSSITGSN